MSDIRLTAGAARPTAAPPTSGIHHTPNPAASIDERVLVHPKFQRMARQKSVIGWAFSAVIFLVYVSFIWVIGTSPQLFAARVNPDGVTTWGIYIGIFVIVFSFVMTGIYVWIANSRFDAMTQEVVAEVMEGAEK